MLFALRATESIVWVGPFLSFTPQSDEAEQVWVWEYETDEGAHDLYMDPGEEIRFRVADEVFVDTSPTGPAAAKTDAPAPPGQSTAPPAEESGEKKEAPYTLVVRTVTFPFQSFNTQTAPIEVEVHENIQWVQLGLLLLFS